MSSRTAPPKTSTPPSTPSSLSSPDTDPTTDPPCSSPPGPPPESSSSTSTPSAGSSSLASIRYTDRVFLTGKTGTGKSYLARSLFLSTPAPRMVIDPVDSSMTSIPGAVTFSDPGRATNPQGENWREAPTARFVPHDPEDLDAYDAVYRWVFNHFPRYVWLDEAADAMPARATKQAWPRKVLIHGRKRSIGHLACHTRPREVNRNLIAQAAHVFVFQTPNFDDRRHLADQMGFTFAEFEEAHGALVEHGFLWYDLRANQLRVCPPL